MGAYQVKSLEKQLVRLNELFPGLFLKPLTPQQRELAKTPVVGTEGWFAVPWMEKIIVPEKGQADVEFSDRVLLKMLELLAKARDGRFSNYRQRQVPGRSHRNFGSTLAFLRRMWRDQESPDVLIIPAQLGSCYSGTWVKTLRENPKSREFGLPAFLVVLMLLTHPERLQQPEDLRICCPGDEVMGSGGCFDAVPTLQMGCGGTIWFEDRWIGLFNDQYGAATARIPDLSRRM